jgi:hypothetical protein
MKCKVVQKNICPIRIVRGDMTRFDTLCLVAPQIEKYSRPRCHNIRTEHVALVNPTSATTSDVNVQLHQ